jgi:hypothetical protein
MAKSSKLVLSLLQVALRQVGGEEERLIGPVPHAKLGAMFCTPGYMSQVHWRKRSSIVVLRTSVGARNRGDKAIASRIS